MNEFCRNCEHKKIPDILKNKYNEVVSKTFIECPMNDKNVWGCLIKDLNINWEAFHEWLVIKEVINKSEKAILERKGWTVPIRD